MGAGEISGEMETKKRNVDRSRAIPALQGSGTVLEKGIEMQGCGGRIPPKTAVFTYVLFVSLNMKYFKVQG